jgi:ribonuclease J
MPLFRCSSLNSPRQFITDKETVKINGLEIEMVPVDHSIFGGCGFIIHGSDQTIIYSGDIRLHGTYGKKTEEFARRASEAKPDILLMEGTRIADGKVSESEAYVRQNASKTAKETKGLVIADGCLLSQSTSL